MRLDQALVRMGLAPSRNKAQELIESGRVEILEDGLWKTCSSASKNVSAFLDKPAADWVRLAGAELLKYVSRGGLKLESALAHLRLDVRGWTCLDCGQSTGGFTDCLLQAGADRVVGFDVGRDQLAPRLRQDPRVRWAEGLHLRDLAESEWYRAERPARGFDLIVADLSFISIEKAFPCLRGQGSRLLALVKPQFEAGPENLNRRGVLADDTLIPAIESRVRKTAEENGWKTLDFFASGLEGRDGNREFFLYADPIEEKPC